MWQLSHIQNMHNLAKIPHFHLYSFFFPLVLKFFSYSVGNFLMRTVLFEDDPSPSLKRNLSYPNDQENCTKFTASPASSVGLQDNSETAFWHWDLPLTSVVSMTEKPKSTFPSLQILLIGKIILGQGFFFAAAGTLGIFMEEMNGEFRARLVALIYRWICRALEYL